MIFAVGVDVTLFIIFGTDVTFLSFYEEFKNYGPVALEAVRV